MNERIFQKRASESLKRGQSVIIVAPTGLGKTRAALLPFYESQKEEKNLIGTRLIYTLPLRALAHGVERECHDLGIEPVIHHGDEPESQFFSERAIITTIDQYLTAFTGAPLSWASHLSHAAAGAALTSYSVFDEVHLLSPQRGLQLLFAMLYLRNRWGLISCVMTATLPSSTIELFKEYCGLEEIRPDETDIKQREEWREVCIELIGTRNTNSFTWKEMDEETLATLAKQYWEDWQNIEVTGSKKMIIFVNTVERAIKLYDNLRKRIDSDRNHVQILLAHSRFTKDDRRRIEENLYKYFGEQAGQIPAILVTTQVAEAGLNISAPLVITELCPMDSLIQRAGRCSRFKPKDNNKAKGRIIIVKPSGNNWFVPYTDKITLVKKRKNSLEKKTALLIDFTKEVLEQEIGTDVVILNWEKEKDLIEKALNKCYETYLSGKTDLELDKDDRIITNLFNKIRKKTIEVEEEESFLTTEEEE